MITTMTTTMLMTMRTTMMKHTDNDDKQVRFCQCNPSLAMSVDSVYVMCFSLILLSVDLSSPHVKNKMSKREFIRNTRGAVGAEVGRGLEEDLYGSLYDNIFLRGHIADEERPVDQGKQQFVPGYLALFL